MPQMPTLDPVKGRRTSFQDRLSISREGGGTSAAWEAVLEARADQSVQAPLPNRIVIKELRRRRVEFEFQSDLGTRQLTVGGIPVDIIVYSTSPYLVIQILADRDRGFLDYPSRDEMAAAAVEAAGYRYAHLWDQDVFEAVTEFQYMMDGILGESIPSVSAPGSKVAQLPTFVPLYGPAPSPLPPSGTAPTPPPSVPPEPGGTLTVILEDFMRPIPPNTPKVPAPVPGTPDMQQLLELLHNHGDAHSRTGTDPIEIVRYTQAIAITLKNASGSWVPEGTWVAVQLIGGKLAFTTTSTIGDERVCGVTAEAIADTTLGRVIVEGFAPRVRVESSVTSRQFLRQGATTGVAEGQDHALAGSHGLALTDYDAATGTCSAILLHIHGEEAFISGTYESIDSAVQNISFWRDLSGLQATVASNDAFTTYVAGTGVAQAFTVDPTTGRTVFSLPSSSTPVNSVSGIRIRNTFTPRTLDDYGFKVIGQLTTAYSTGGDGTSANIFGLLTAELAHASYGAPDGIYFKRWVDDSGSGGLQQDLWQLVASTAGTATTVDLGTKPLDGELHLWEFRITGSGTSVQAYVDNVATGLPITTNLPATSTLLIPTVARWRGTYQLATPALTIYGIGMQSGF